MTRGRVGRPVRHDQNYNYRKVPLNYAIHPAFLAWVSLKREPQGLGALACPASSQAGQGTDIEHNSMPKVVSTQVDVLPTDM